jgi:hypothetical protein
VSHALVPSMKKARVGARKTTQEVVVSFVVTQKQRLEPCCSHDMSCLWSDKRLEKMGILSDPDRCKLNTRILLANLFQGSRSPFACLRFSSLSAFKEGMRGTQISALLGSPTVSTR